MGGINEISVLCTVCGPSQYHETENVITSPNYPDNYPTNVTCHYTISGAEGSMITFWFDHFQLDRVKNEKDCGDNVTVSDLLLLVLHHFISISFDLLSF